MHIAEIGCDNVFQRELIEIQLQAANESNGNVPIQKANMMASVMELEGAAAAASTKK